MKKFAFLTIFLALPLGVFSFSHSKDAEALSEAQTPVVLELFTSQSCSSCPPADRVLGELAAKNDNIIALSCNVTYWNHLHWKDTLSKDFCTQRQRSYVQALKSRGPYTPQIVINGKYEMVGSRGANVQNTIANDLKQNKLKAIDLSFNKNQLNIQLPENASSDSYALLLITHGDVHEQSIPSGENRGRTVSYTNPVQNIVSLGTWDGTAKNMSYNIAGMDKAKGYVVLAQKNGVTGPIIAAGKILAP